MLSLEQIIKNTKQNYQFNALQIRNVLQKVAFLTGASYLKETSRIKAQGLVLG